VKAGEQPGAGRQGTRGGAGEQSDKSCNRRHGASVAQVIRKTKGFRPSALGEVDAGRRSHL
jgi:hypothetical protein